MSKLYSKKKGIYYILLSSMFFALMNMFVRLSGDIPVIQKSFFRNFVAMLIALAMFRKEKVNWNIGRKNWGILFIRAFFGTVGVLCNFYAVSHLVLSDASMLNKLSPFFAILLSSLFLREKFSFRQGIYVVLAFIGSLFIIKPTFSNTDLFASLLGAFGGFSAGAAYTAVRYLGQRGVNKSLIIFAFSGFSCLVTLPSLLFQFHPMTPLQWVYLLLAGLAAAGGQLTITSAYSYAPAKEISVYDYSQVIFSAILGFFLFSQVPDAYSILGYIIISSVAIISYLKQQS